MHAHLVVEVLDRTQALMLRVLQRGQLHLDACKLGRSVSMQSPVSMHSRASMQSPGRVQARTFVDRRAIWPRPPVGRGEGVVVSTCMQRSEQLGGERFGLGHLWGEERASW